MKKAIIRIISVISYLIAFSVLAIYVTVESTVNSSIAPKESIVMLGFSCICIYIGSLLFGKSLNELKAKKLMKITLWMFFAIYAFLVLTFTLFDRYYGRTAASGIGWSSDAFSMYIQNSVNLIPFKTIFEYVSGIFTQDKNLDAIITNLFGNICAFMPCALFLPVLFNKINNWNKFVLTMVCIIAVIELAQLLLLTGSLDVDDLILNVGGAWLMYGVLQSAKVKKLVNKVTLQN